MSEHVASVESLIEMERSMLRYQRGEGDRVSEHVASVGSIIEMVVRCLETRGLGWRSSE